MSCAILIFSFTWKHFAIMIIPAYSTGRRTRMETNGQTRSKEI